MPILILVMTTMLNVSMTVAPQTGVETVAEGFDHVWQTIGTVSGESAGMSKIGMRSINRLYFFAVVTYIFVGRNFRSGYVRTSSPSGQEGRLRAVHDAGVLPCRGADEAGVSCRFHAGRRDCRADLCPGGRPPQAASSCACWRRSC